MKKFKLLKGYKFEDTSNYILNNVFGVSGITFNNTVISSTQQYVSIIPRIIYYTNNTNEIISYIFQFTSTPTENRICFSGTIEEFRDYTTTSPLFIYEICRDNGEVYRVNDSLPSFSSEEKLYLICVNPQ